MEISFKLNGEAVTIVAEPRTLLVHAIRDACSLTGTKIGCDTSQCGACTVLVDGLAMKSCTVLAARIDGAEVTTIEGLSSDGRHPLQEAFRLGNGFQCGFCTPGMIMAAVDLLGRSPAPDEAAIREGLKGNLCRCTGYQAIVDAVQVAAVALAEASR